MNAEMLWRAKFSNRWFCFPKYHKLIPNISIAYLHRLKIQQDRAIDREKWNRRVPTFVEEWKQWSLCLSFCTFLISSADCELLHTIPCFFVSLCIKRSIATPLKNRYFSRKFKETVWETTGDCEVWVVYDMFHHSLLSAHLVVISETVEDGTDFFSLLNPSNCSNPSLK